MDVDEILRVALAKEKASHRFYSDMLMERRAEIAGDLLQRLKNEEYRHIRMIETMMARLEMGKDMA
jgi:rubrerythrin